MRKNFMEKLLLELLENRKEVYVNKIMSMCEDILRYLEHETEEDYETNQQYVGIKELFRGFTIID